MSENTEIISPEQIAEWRQRSFESYIRRGFPESLANRLATWTVKSDEEQEESYRKSPKKDFRYEEDMSPPSNRYVMPGARQYLEQLPDDEKEALEHSGGHVLITAMKADGWLPPSHSFQLSENTMSDPIEMLSSDEITDCR